MPSRRSLLCGLCVSVIVVIVPLVLARVSSAAPEKVKVLIVTGFDVGSHKWPETTQLARTTLQETGRFDVKVCEDVGIFESSALAKYDVVVLNYGFWRAPSPSPAGKAGLLNYVKSGKGLVALHFACSSFQEWGEYKDLLGRVWKKGTGGHGPKGVFTVNIKRKDHPIVAGIPDFKIDDELYAKLSGDDKIDVLASAYSEWSKQVEPMVFTKSYGNGRVYHNVLGHGIGPRQNEHYKTLFRRGVEWAATGKVTVK